MHKINMAMVKREESLQTSSSSDRDLVATLNTFLLLLLFILLSSLLLTMGELVMFSWHNRGRQTVWAALMGEIKNTLRKKKGKDDSDEGNVEWKEDKTSKAYKVQCDDEDSIAAQNLLENDGRENTRL